MSHASCYHVSYSLTCAEYDDLLALSRGCCMICAQPTAPLLIDHDHRIGQWAVRGLACNACNQHLKCVDAGRRPATGATARYLANAWHLRQPSSDAKRGRVKARASCVRCRLEVSVRPNGNLYRHWSRLPGMSEQLCAA